MSNTIHISVTDATGTDITDQFSIQAGATAPVDPIDPIDPDPIDPPPVAGDVIPRPYGLAYMVPGYERPTVPSNARVWSKGDYDSLQAAIADACEAGVALFIDVPGDYTGDFYSIKLPSGLFGVEGVTIRNTGDVENATPCGFYMVDRDSYIVGIEFVDFGTVFGMSTRSMSVARGYAEPWDIHGSRRSAYGTGRCIDADSDFSGTKSGTPLDYNSYPESLTTIGPEIWISDCTFTDCENVLFEWSDCIGIGRVDFHRNKLVGTYGGCALEGSWWTEFHAVNNLWSDCVEDREIPSGVKASRFSTFANLGTNAGVDVGVIDQVVQIFNNEARDIHCLINSDGTNAAVFMDARGCTPSEILNPDDPFEWWCSAECSFNEIVGVLGIRGQEDANALYGKTRGMLIEGNYIEDCGSYYYAEGSGTDGAEATGTEFKQTAEMDKAPTGAALVFRGNEFVEMPPKDKNAKLQAVMGTNDIGLRLWVIGNTFTGCNITNTGGSVPALIRHYGYAPEIKMICNEFYDCEITSPAALMGVHSAEGNPGPNSEFSNNIAYGDYAEAQQLIYSSSSMSGAKVGLNELIDNHSGSSYPMTANFGSADGVIKQVYIRPTVEVPSV